VDLADDAPKALAFSVCEEVAVADGDLAVGGDLGWVGASSAGEEHDNH